MYEQWKGLDNLKNNIRLMNNIKMSINYL